MKKKYDLSPLNENMSVVKLILKKINKDFVSLNYRYFEHNGKIPLVFEIKNRSKVIHRVIWDNNASKHDSSSNEELTYVKDPDFSILKGLLLYPNGFHKAESLKYESDQKTLLENFKNILNFLTLKNDSKKALNLYNNTYHIGIKNSLISIFKLVVRNPYKRFYIFGSREIRPQYSRSPFKLKSGMKVLIADSTALCFDSDGEKSIDLDSGFTYFDKKNFYVGAKWKLKPTSKGSKTHQVTSHKADGTCVYYAKIKPSNDEIKASKKIPYHSVEGQMFKLLIKGNSVFLVDLKTKEKLRVTHCDLGVDIL